MRKSLRNKKKSKKQEIFYRFKYFNVCHRIEFDVQIMAVTSSVQPMNRVVSTTTNISSNRAEEDKGRHYLRSILSLLLTQSIQHFIRYTFWLSTYPPTMIILNICVGATLYPMKCLLIPQKSHSSLYGESYGSSSCCIYGWRLKGIINRRRGASGASSITGEIIPYY